MIRGLSENSEKLRLVSAYKRKTPFHTQIQVIHVWVGGDDHALARINVHHSNPLRVFVLELRMRYACLVITAPSSSIDDRS